MYAEVAHCNCNCCAHHQMHILLCNLRAVYKEPPPLSKMEKVERATSTGILQQAAVSSEKCSLMSSTENTSSASSAVPFRQKFTVFFLVCFSLHPSLGAPTVRQRQTAPRPSIGNMGHLRGKQQDYHTGPSKVSQRRTTC